MVSIATADSLVTGLATLLGAAVGGIIAALVALKVERASQAYATRTEQQRAAMRLRAAANLLWLELGKVGAVCAHYASDVDQARLISTPVWDKHAEDLAGSTLDAETIRVVLLAYACIESVNIEVSHQATAVDEACWNAATTCKEAQDALARIGYGGYEDRPSRGLR